MPAERIAPSAILEQTNLTGAVAAVSDDPDSPDGSWLTAASTNADSILRVSFPSPQGDLSTTPTAQEFRVRVRKAGGTGTPTCRVEVWENGVLRLNGSDDPVTSTTGVVISKTWTASGVTITDQTGAGIELRIYGTRSGGSPSVRAALEVGAVEWNADYLTPVEQHSGTATLAGAGSTTATGGKGGRGTATISAAATVAATGSTARAGSVTVAGSGAVATTGSPSRTGTLGLAGSGTVAAVGSSSRTGTTSIAASGAITVSGAVGAETREGTVAVAGVGAAMTAGTAARSGSTTIGAPGSVAASGAAVRRGSLALSADGTVTVAGQGSTIVAGSVLITGSGSLSLSGLAARYGALLMSGLIAGQATGSSSRGGSLALTGTGALVMSGARVASVILADVVVASAVHCAASAGHLAPNAVAFTTAPAVEVTCTNG